jgi:hypothetical protein
MEIAITGAAIGFTILTAGAGAETLVMAAEVDAAEVGAEIGAEVVVDEVVAEGATEATEVVAEDAVESTEATLEGGSETSTEPANACHSFAPTTHVVLADGSSKAISEVSVGDRVRTTDPDTGKAVTRRVTALHRNHDSDLADVVVRDSDGNDSTMHTTQLHRFWDDTQHGWVEAADLTSGDRLHTEDGDSLVVQSVRSFAGPEWMYDLTVDQVHTYYVATGRTSVLVHNCGLDELSQSGSELDPGDAGGQLTRAGRAFAKAKEVFGPTSGGPSEINAAGQDALDEILTNPGTIEDTMQTGRFAGGPRFVAPNGTGAVFGPDGAFQYFGWM